MNQLQTAQPTPVQPMNQPMEAATGQMTEKKSGGLKWLIIILVILIVVGGLAWWIFTP